MAKTEFSSGVVVSSDFLNSLYHTLGGHVHDSGTDDGSSSKVNLSAGAHVQGTLPNSMVEAHTHDGSSQSKINLSSATHVQGTLPIANMDQTGILALIEQNRYAQGYIHGFSMSISQVSGSDWHLFVSAGSCRDVGDSQNIDIASAFEKVVVDYAGTDFDDWVSGTGNGGVASGLVIAENLWLHVFVIADADAGTVDVGLDTSITAANLKTDTAWGDDFRYRRIGSIRMTGSSPYDIAFFGQHGDHFSTIQVATTVISGLTGQTWQLVTLNSLFCPPDVVCELELFVSSSHNVFLQHGIHGQSPAIGGGLLAVGADSLVTLRVIADESRQVWVYPDHATPAGTLQCNGYRDFRGKE